MPRKRIPKSPIKVGDFVFAKVNGYRAWPARVLEASTHYYVYFYGTCSTTNVSRNQIFSFEHHRRRLGNLNKAKFGRNSTFRMAMRHLELVYSDPINDFGYYQGLAALKRHNDVNYIMYRKKKRAKLKAKDKENCEADAKKPMN